MEPSSVRPNDGAELGRSLAVPEAAVEERYHLATQPSAGSTQLARLRAALMDPQDSSLFLVGAGLPHPFKAPPLSRPTGPC